MTLTFDWEYQKSKSLDTWRRRFEELKVFALENDGDPNIRRSHPNKTLFNWVWTQRGLRKKMRSSEPVDETFMTLEQERLLEELGIDWDPIDDEWQRRFDELKVFKERHGHCYPNEVEPVDAALDSWARKQRVDNEKGRLSEERKKQLDSLEFGWASVAERKWHLSLGKLREYHAKHRNSDVPNNWKNDKQLASWVSQQRTQRKAGKLTEEQIRLLDELNFTWVARERGTWEDNIDRVRAFVALHGHCEIPTSYSPDPKLGRFVNNVRSQKNRGQLSAERIVELDAFGFAWGMSARATALVDGVQVSGAWKKRFDELCDYKEKFGHCNVPTKTAEYPKLGNWVSQQRQDKKRGTLKPEREALLNDVGFQW